MDKLYFRNTLKTKVKVNRRDGLAYLRITRSMVSTKEALIQQSIDTFNSEIDWDGMWDIVECEKRLYSGQILYLLVDDMKIIGHLWYDKNLLYNVFVSNKRQDGDSMWFVQKTMYDMKQCNDLTYIELTVDVWNKRAIRFWKKLNFKEGTL